MTSPLPTSNKKALVNSPGLVLCPGIGCLLPIHTSGLRTFQLALCAFLVMFSEKWLLVQTGEAVNHRRLPRWTHGKD